MKNNKISVIILNYNNYEYLDECISSVVNQTYKNLEIIISDDGSTDKSLDIINRYANTDKRIKVMAHKNVGVGKSFNDALRIATGEYIAEVDSDDYLELDMYENLINNCSNSDIVKGGYYDTSKERIIPVKICDDIITFNPILLDIIQRKHLLCFQPSLWSAIYRRQFLIDNNIRMLETDGASYNDTSFIFKANIMAEKITLLPTCYYHWRTDNINSSTKHIKPFAVIGEYEEIEKYLYSKPDKLLYYRDILSRMRYGSFCWAYQESQSKVFYKYMSQIIKYDWDFQDSRLYSENNWNNMINIVMGNNNGL